MCECMAFCITGKELSGNHHHKNCKKYKTEKYQYLFYYDEGVNAWIQAPDKTNDIADMAQNDIVIIEFKQFNLTDFEYDNLKET